MSKRFEVEELKRLALRLRQQLGMENVLYLDLLAVLEMMKRVLPRFSLHLTISLSASAP
ncbi:MAG TPA: hypothetical protein VFN27_12090 [Xanthobacteraceae bacterium]|nr:hypothetical protein [Xanthobacteraceae bacterium]